MKKRQKLIDVIANFDENKAFYVYDTDNNLLSYYDGKNAIDASCNDAVIISYSTDSNGNGNAIIDA